MTQGEGWNSRNEAQSEVLLDHRRLTATSLRFDGASCSLSTGQMWRLGNMSRHAANIFSIRRIRIQDGNDWSLG